ncbi:hypothetical protein LTR28_003412 [Elasticomyces elasticus]|nr:hypothetical protein LTR28_003412 [Elasticomyces elasticus]
MQELPLRELPKGPAEAQTAAFDGDDSDVQQSPATRSYDPSQLADRSIESFADMCKSTGTFSLATGGPAGAI